MKDLRAVGREGLRCALGSWYKKKMGPFPPFLLPFFPSESCRSALPLYLQPFEVKPLEWTSSCTLARCPGAPVACLVAEPRTSASPMAGGPGDTQAPTEPVLQQAGMDKVSLREFFYLTPSCFS